MKPWMRAARPETTLSALVATLLLTLAAPASAAPAADATAKTWDVESTWGPTHDVAIDVR